jgi:hypothetical protein
MKIKLLVVLAIIGSWANAQVSFNNQAIEVDQPVTITLDSNSTATDCNGFDNPTKVYMHSGIGDNTNAFGFSVTGNYGQDDGIGEMSNNGDGTYSITIIPQTYYDLSQVDADNATQIGMVFRNEDGSQELKSNGCSDFVFLIGTVNMIITQPSSNLVVLNSGDDLSISASIAFQGETTVQGTFEVFYNDVAVASGNCGFPACNTTISNITENGIVRFVGSPPNSSDFGEASFEVFITSAVTEEAIPNDLEDGVNYSTDQTKATLVLSAPGKEFIQVAGSFNNYEPTTADVMKRDPNTGKYWLELTGLTPGQTETYQYWVFDTNPISNSPSLVKTADPFSTVVLSPFDDPSIPANSYPNLPAYPAGQEREVSVIKTGQTPFNWQVPNFNAPKKEDLIVYEVLIRDFDADRNYQTLIDRIDYFKNLNINAIQLMPVMEFEGNESWGYNTSFHMALDKFYGTEDKFKEFIDLCHQNGIAVILDVALNHAFGRNPLVRMWMDDPDNDGWGGPSSDSPYFNEVPLHSYNVGYDFNHQSTLTQDYTKRIVKHWIEDFKIDGFRWDLTKGFTQNCTANDEGCTNSYQQDRVDILKDYVDYSWGLDENHYAIFEHLGSENEEKEWANYRFSEGKGVMMWGKMTDPYNQLTMGYESNSAINGIGHKSRSQFEGPRLMGYSESHDDERLMYKNVMFGNNSTSSHNVQDLDIALSRMSALGAVSLTVPGPKMIWHFGALGMDNSIFTCTDTSVNDPNCKLDTKPQPQWAENWTGDTNRAQIYNDWARLIELKINEAVFEGDYTITSGNLTPRIDVFDESLAPTELNHVVILANFDVIAQTIDTNFPDSGNWFDLMDTEGNTTYSASTISIAPGQFRIFGNTSSTLAITDVDRDEDVTITPNPVSSIFKINKSISNLHIYDLSGKLIMHFNGELSAEDSYDISDLTAGMYIVKITNNNGYTQSSKLIKI